MPDNKLTDNEIVKALECCSTYKGKCTDCPAFVKVDCSNCKKVLLGAVEIINRLQADCENYKQVAENQQSVTIERGFEVKRLKEKIESLQAENERLGKFKEYFDCLYGLNLEVLGWHENGNPIDFDEFYDSAIADMENAEKEMVGDTGV